MADMIRPASRVHPRAGRGGVSPGSDDAPQKSTAPAPTQDIRADAVAAIELFRELYPRAFPLYGARLPLKIGIDADIIRAVRGAMTPREVSDAVRFYTSSAAYLRCLRPGAERIDLAGNPVGIVTREEAGRAAETLATRIIKSANRRAAGSTSAIPASRMPPAPETPKHLGSSDLKTALLERQSLGAAASHAGAIAERTGVNRSPRTE
jgi:ProP effector